MQILLLFGEDVEVDVELEWLGELTFSGAFNGNVGDIDLSHYCIDFEVRIGEYGNWKSG